MNKRLKIKIEEFNKIHYKQLGNRIIVTTLKVKDKNFEKKVSKLVPLKRMANADEYITTIQYLLSPSNSYINGSTIVVDGGRTII